MDAVYLRHVPSAAQVERIALVIGLTAGAALAALVGWLGFHAYDAQAQELQRELLVRTAEDVAVNLSSVDYQHADADAQRIADSATGGFADSFAHQRQAYVDAATRTRTKSLGRVSDAGLESQNGNQGRVLVAVTVKSADPAQEPRFLRMRLTVQRLGDDAKVSDVEFVS